MAQQDRERGDRVAELRKRAGYSSADKLAAALDVNYRSVQNWEAGKGISEENLQQLAELLGVSRELILYGNGATPDVFGMTERDDFQVQLDRIERKVDEILRRQDAADREALETADAGAAPTPLRQRRTRQGPRAPRKRAEES